MNSEEHNLTEFLTGNAVPWLAEEAGHSACLVSSRIRLARNLAGVPFPKRANMELRKRVYDTVMQRVSEISPLRGAFVAEMTAFDDIDKKLLIERRLISPELAKCGCSSGVACSRDQKMSIMVNEEDHVRLQVIVPKMLLADAWQKAAELNSALESALEYAFRADLGFLTACPTNVGTGLRGSVMLHLPGLMLLGQLGAVSKAARALGFTIRGAFGEGSEPIGDLVQVSNQSTLGESEESIISRLTQAVRRLVEHEENARLRLVRTERGLAYDFVGRAYGVLSQARMLTADEALARLSGIRLGVDLGLLSGLTSQSVSRLFLLVQAGHLQKTAGRNLDERERQEYRAKIVRSFLRSPSGSGVDRIDLANVQ